MKCRHGGRAGQRAICPSSVCAGPCRCGHRRRKLALIDWTASVLVMSCHTRTVPAAVDGAAAVRAPASRRHSAGRHRAHGRSAGVCARGSSPAAADLGLGLRAKHGRMAVREEADIADAVEPIRHGVEQESPNEFIDSKRHHLGLAVVAIVLPDEVDLAVAEPGVLDAAGPLRLLWRWWQ